MGLGSYTNGLLSKGRGVLAAATLAGVLGFSGGCKGLFAAGMTSRDPATRLISTVLYHDEDHKEDMEVAREGRTVVNVGGGNEVNGSVRPKKHNVKIHKWKDFNENGIYDSSEDLGDVGEYVNIDAFNLAVGPEIKYVNPITYRIISEDGEIIYNEKFSWDYLNRNSLMSEGRLIDSLRMGCFDGQNIEIHTYQDSMAGTIHVSRRVKVRRTKKDN